jgi:Right handed beta helix region
LSCLTKKRLLAIAGTTLAILTLSAPAHAQATRTWVSGVGDDANPCSRTAPCRTFAGAFPKTFINGEINCIDPGGFGAVTITKSITIDCTGTLGSILASGTNGIEINVAVNANDPFRSVRLRGLSINGTGASGTIGTRTGLRGIHISQAATVIIEDVVVSDFSVQGVSDTRSAGGALFIRNSMIRDTTGTGIGVAGSGGTNNAVIENVHSINNGFGLAAGSGNQVSVTRSVFSGNTSAGVEADAGGQIGLDNSVVSANATGLQNGGTMSISNSSFSFNTTGISGATTSFGNNRIFGNVAAGTAPSVGATSSDHGQQ